MYIGDCIRVIIVSIGWIIISLVRAAIVAALLWSVLLLGWGSGWLTWVISALLLRDILYRNLGCALVVKGSFLF